ncbi:MAG: hypothetical protein ACRDRY_18540 [Pseudonocardiaceae bacterium]
MRIAEIFDLGHHSGYDRGDRGHSYGRRGHSYGRHGKGRYGRRRHRGGGLISIRIGGY